MADFSSTGPLGESEDKPFYEDVVDFVKYGVSSAAVSAGIGFVNTGKSFANLFGADFEETDTFEALRSAGMYDTSKYYEENRSGIDALGFAVGSLIPGIGGIKTLNAAQKAIGASSRLSTGFKRVLIPENVVETARKSLVDKSRTVANAQLKESTLARAVNAVHREGLETAAFVSATALLYNQSPTLGVEDLNYFEGIAAGLDIWNGAFLLGTGVGAGFRYFVDRGAIKSLIGNYDATNKHFIRVQNEGNLNIANGSKILSPYSSYIEKKKLKNSPDYIKRTAGEKAEIDSSLAQSRLRVLEELKNTIPDPELRKAAFIDMDMWDTETAMDKAYEKFANINEWERLTEKDIIFQSPVSPVEVVQREEYENAAAHSLAKQNNVTPEQARASSQFQELVAGANGFANANWDVKYIEGLPEDFTGALGFVNLDKTHNLIRTMDVLRHETGHLFLNNKVYKTAEGNYLNAHEITIKDFGKLSKTAKKVIDSAEALSRRRRPDGWRNFDIYQESIKDGSFVTFPQASKQALIKAKDYYPQALEVFADAYVMFKNPVYADRLIKEHPELYKYMRNNKALDQIFRKGKEIYNMKTKRFQSTGAIPDAADYRGPIKVTKNGKVLFNEDKRSVVIPRGMDEFDFFSANPVDANALYSAASLREDITDGSEINFTNLFAIQAAVQKKKQVKIFMKFEDGKREEVTYGFGGAQFETLEDLAIYAKVMKGKELMEDSNKGLFVQTWKNEFENPEDFANSVRSPEHIAKLLDTGPEFVENIPYYYAKFKSDFYNTKLAEKDLLKEKTIPFYSIAFDPLKPTHMISKVHSGGVKNGARIRGIEETNAIIKQQREFIKGALARYTPKYIEQFSQNASEAGINFGDDIQLTDSAASFLGSVSSRFGSGISVMERNGKIRELALAEKKLAVDTSLQASGFAVMKDESALYEFAALSAKVRQLKSGEELILAPSDLPTLLSKLKINEPGELQIFEEIASEKLFETLLRNPEVTGTKFISSDIFQKLSSYIKDISTGDEFFDPRDFADFINDLLVKRSLEVRNGNLANLLESSINYNKTEFLPFAKEQSLLMGKKWNPDSDSLYLGPINTKLYKYHAVVKSNDQSIMASKDIGMVHAATKEALQDKIAKIKLTYGDSVEIFSDPAIERFKKLEDEYKASMLFGENVMDSSLRKQGLAWEVMPEPNPGQVTDFIDMWKTRQTQLMDNFLELNYSEELGLIREYAYQENLFASKYGYKREKDNSIYDQAIKLMFGRSTASPDSLWTRANMLTSEKLSEGWAKVVSAFTKHKQTGDWEKMNEELGRMGLDQVYKPFNQLILHDTQAPRPVAERVTAKMNTYISTSMLQLDPTHGIVNIASAPIQWISELSGLEKFATSDRVQVFRDGTSQVIPGTKNKLPNMMALVYQAHKDLASGHPAFGEYAKRGLTLSISEEIRLLNNELAKAIGKKDIGTMEELLDKGLEIGTWATRKSEAYTKAITARVADLATETLGISGDQKWSAINTFVNRVNGNYLASQRPHMFQGWMGQAIGLFQTYQFNLIQNFIRHVEGGDKKAIAKMVGLQAGIFGAQSIPGFQLANNYIGERSLEGNDFYSTTTGLLGDEIGNWLLYGGASSAMIPVLGNGIDLYSRGDLTPRTPILIPTSPTEVPAISISSKFFSTLYNMGERTFQGSPALESFKQALAHNGLNRPIQGLAQIWAGGRTTADGSLLVDYSNQEDNLLKGFDWGNAIAKGMGTKKLDEAIAVNSFYRTAAYESYRQGELNDLGKTVKNVIRSGNWDSDAYLKFMDKYSAEGGNLETYSRWVKNNMRNSTEGQIDKLRQDNDSVRGRYMQGVMGGDVGSYSSDGDVEIPVSP